MDEFYTIGYSAFNIEKFVEVLKKYVIKVEEGMELGYKFALMCAEKRPEECHKPDMAELIRQSYIKRNLETGYRLAED